MRMRILETDIRKCGCECEYSVFKDAAIFYGYSHARRVAPTFFLLGPDSKIISTENKSKFKMATEEVED